MVDSPSWTPPERQPVVRPGELHLWRLLPGEETQPDQTVLAADETARAKRLLDHHKRSFFVACRVQLRQLLARYLDSTPAGITLMYGRYGKPAIAPPADCGITFNLSHSGDYAVVAIGHGSPVGVDLEMIDHTLDFYPLADRFYTRQEQNLLRQTPPARQRRTFYRLWTAKEALLKLNGTGFSQSSSTPVQTASVCHFYVAPRAVAAVAWTGQIVRVRKYDGRFSF